jgi:hypothetical protein
MKIIVLVMWPLFFLISFLLFKKSKLSIFSNTYSNLGVHPEFGNIFNFLLVTIGTLQLLFLLNVLKIMRSTYNFVGITGLICLIITTLAGILTGLITEEANKSVHLMIAKIGFMFSIVGFIIYGLFFITNNIFVGVFMLSWGVIIMPYQIYVHLSGRNLYAKNEFFMFLGAFLTNVSLVLLYYF